MYKNIADSFKEFSYDLIGFFIPGFIGIVIAIILLDLNTIGSLFNSEALKSINELMIIVFSYLLGYVAMGMSEFMKKTFKTHVYTTRIENKIEASSLYSDALEKYKNQMGITEEIDFRKLRTRIMSYIPEADGKIYDFRFRSDLCENTIKILIFIVILAIPILAFQNCSDLVILKEPLSLVISFLLFLIPMIVFLSYTRNRYYSITMRVPLSIYLAKKID